MSKLGNHSAVKALSLGRVLRMFKNPSYETDNLCSVHESFYPQYSDQLYPLNSPVKVLASLLVC